MRVQWYCCGILLFTSVLNLQAQSIEDDFNNPCKGDTCGECIQVAPQCAWCGDEVFPRGKKRCDKLKNHQGKCRDITFPKSSAKEVKNDMWTSGGADKSPVQVRPQVMNFTVRTNDPITFKLQFQQQANYPVDLYFLLDLSFGMVRQQEAQIRLKQLGNAISEVMSTITSNFKLGFGTFVDKLLMPYTAWTDTLLRDRCPYGPGKECRQPHDYKNEMNLTEDPKEFKTKMASALEYVSQSLDDAEGGLDGLIQALDCDVIGWREVSRRIIVYSSNSLFHLAGAGKLGGATKQSNLKCSLSEDGTYKMEKIYDYPSVSEIASKLKEKKANVIFAVMEQVEPHYVQLKNFLDGAVVGKLENNSQNIVQLITEKYQELRSQIKFQANNADNVNVQFKSKCLGNIMSDTAVCDNLEIGDQVDFDVTLTVDPAICNGKKGIVEQNVSIDAVGLKEKLEIQLRVMCECECELAVKATNSDECSNNGAFECGICDCNPGRYGRFCECDASQITNEESLAKCRRFPDKSNETCSGNGECVCGQCVCFELPFQLIEGVTKDYSGEFCQCNDYSCPIGSNGELCSGNKQGVCDCGTCTCLSGWSGDDCSCTTDNSSCMAQVQMEDGSVQEILCSGYGSCNCGKCKCTEESGRVGPTCEECLDCNTRCSEYRACAQCVAHGTGMSQQDCDEQCGHAEAVNTLPEGEGIRPCEGRDVDGCTFYFTYQYTADNDVIVKSQITKNCPEEAPVVAIVGGTVAAVVLIPLLAICLIIFIRNKRDAKEFAEFMKERDKARWDSGANPIYKDPKSTFQNPTYKGGK